MGVSTVEFGALMTCGREEGMPPESEVGAAPGTREAEEAMMIV